MSYEVSSDDWRNLGSLPLTDGGTLEDFENDEQPAGQDEEDRFRQLNCLPMYSDDENNESFDNEVDLGDNFYLVSDIVYDDLLEDASNRIFGNTFGSIDQEYEYQDEFQNTDYDYCDDEGEYENNEDVEDIEKTTVENEGKDTAISEVNYQSVAWGLFHRSSTGGIYRGGAEAYGPSR